MAFTLKRRKSAGRRKGRRRFRGAGPSVVPEGDQREELGRVRVGGGGAPTPVRSMPVVPGLTAPTPPAAVLPAPTPWRWMPSTVTPVATGFCTPGFAPA